MESERWSIQSGLYSVKYQNETKHPLRCVVESVCLKLAINNNRLKRTVNHEGATKEGVAAATKKQCLPLSLYSKRNDRNRSKEQKVATSIPYDTHNIHNTIKDE